MDDMQPEVTTPGVSRVEKKRGGGKTLWWLLAIVLAFGAGVAWQYYRAMEIEERLLRTEQELAIERLRVGLAQAAVAAQSGDYEAARVGMSEFFTATQARLDSLPPEVGTVAADILRRRDDVITMLSRGAPESAETLYQMLLRFRISMGGAPEPVIVPTQPATADSGAPAPGS